MLQSISARRTPRRSILPDDHREFPTGNISLNVNEPSSPRKSVVSNDCFSLETLAKNTFHLMSVSQKVIAVHA